MTLPRCVTWFIAPKIEGNLLGMLIKILRVLLGMTTAAQIKWCDLPKLTRLDEVERPTEDALKLMFQAHAAKRDTVAEFRTAWREALTGDTISLEDFLEELDATN